MLLQNEIFQLSLFILGYREVWGGVGGKERREREGGLIRLKISRNKVIFLALSILFFNIFKVSALYAYKSYKKCKQM